MARHRCICSEFQARVARKLAVEMQEGAEGVVEPPPPQRTALGGLRARGAKAKVACDRVACAVRRQQGESNGAQWLENSLMFLSLIVLFDYHCTAHTHIL